MLTIGFETSCDETSVSVVENGMVLSNEVSSSVHLHSEYGGVVPEIASRHHVEYIVSVFEKALSDSGKRKEDLELVAVTQGPGLPGSLLVGITFAKAVSYALDIPIIGVDHVQAHLYSPLLNTGAEMKNILPFTGLVLSGGHTSVFECHDMLRPECIGRTLDDAVGEAFDKAAKIMDLGYPGGPLIEKMARSYSGKKMSIFPKAYLKDSPGIDFSFSGIKTAVLYYFRASDKSDNEKIRISFEFQEAVADVVMSKIKDAVERTGHKRIIVGGGVINNERLRQAIKEFSEKARIRLYIPEKQYCSDNAAMVAGLGELLYASGIRMDLGINAEPNGTMDNKKLEKKIKKR
ncbi:MAG: tRNA (adenosine(37)-N6)-threonylcarbamoyltransferase complex transferase subunit TsaD [Candidatus Omnitrophica bacterium]|nr:tRNA (adenosine(37)-N6)-threonylcarbamoyltransferase complex transferase subunit TsaD [Candidatus Omnitrophota bacterium]